MTIANHETLYFDKIERTSKLQTLVAIANAAVNLREKDKVMKALAAALDIYKEPKGEKLGSGSYVGTVKQWSSKYTLSRDLGLVEESKEEVILSEFGVRLAKGEISAKYFMSVVMLNYIQIINEKIVNPVYSILNELNKNNTLGIKKDEIKKIRDFNIKDNDEDGYVNGLVDILKDTYFFKLENKNTLEINSTLFTVENLLDIVNTTQLQRNLSEIEKEYGVTGQKQWCKYLSLENNELILLLAKGKENSDTILKKETNSTLKKLDEETKEKLQWNRIIFGAPGTGKSYTLNKEKDVFGNQYERVTFHPNYSYGQFVGVYKPVSAEDGVGYKYVPGPFMRVLTKAMASNQRNDGGAYLLIVEEINRANVASVFGDVFQLLDRNSNGESEYEIETSEEMRKYLYDELGGDISEYEKIKIPNNMYIWATMNSADQGVFPMDTAFKRRWDFEYLGVDDNQDKIKDIRVQLGYDKHEVKWNDLRVAINEKLLNECKANEDKLLGPYFLSNSILEADDDNLIKDNEKFLKAFKNKVIMYLFEDAVGRQKRNSFFEECGDSIMYSKICSKFDEIGEGIFGLSLGMKNNLAEDE
ncbi:MAG: AAA family ATPase [Clostridium sp.]|uniref:AAA family ATPase n=1 Tax=Clostridium sp. TaxID=1506 RepID=UPI003F34F5B2